jgi:transposase-like protein
MPSKRKKRERAGEDAARRRGRIWPQHKIEAVLEHLRSEKSVAEICQARGIAQSTFFVWKEQCVYQSDWKS